MLPVTSHIKFFGTVEQSLHDIARGHRQRSGGEAQTSNVLSNCSGARVSGGTSGEENVRAPAQGGQVGAKKIELKGGCKLGNDGGTQGSGSTER